MPEEMFVWRASTGLAAVKTSGKGGESRAPQRARKHEKEGRGGTDDFRYTQGGKLLSKEWRSGTHRRYSVASKEAPVQPQGEGGIAMRSTAPGRCYLRMLKKHKSFAHT